MNLTLEAMGFVMQYLSLKEKLIMKAKTYKKGI